LECFHLLVAKALNVSLDREENFWSSDKTSVVKLESEQDVLREIAYTLANPTAAGLVRSPEEWPGVIAGRFGERLDAEMPDVFFDSEGDLDDETSLQIVRPAIFTHLSDLELQLKVQSEVAAHVRRARRAVEQRGHSFMGREGVLRQSCFDAPVTRARRSKLSPRIAAKAPADRVRALRRLLDFVNTYRVAWLRRRAGERDVVFPAGTYALRIYAGVACAQAP
jgi:putative transposase